MSHEEYFAEIGKILADVVDARLRVRRIGEHLVIDYRGAQYVFHRETWSGRGEIWVCEKEDVIITIDDKGTIQQSRKTLDAGCT